MVKTIVSASVDLEPLLDCKAQGLNISAIVNEAIWAHSKSSPNTKIDILKAEVARIEEKQTELENKIALRRAKFLVEFITKVSFDTLSNEIAMAYWIKETGKTKEELVKLKQES